LTNFDAILFDFDGVLIDSEPVHCACWAEVLAPLGVVLEWDFYSAHCIGIDDRDMLRMMAARSNPPRNWECLWDRYPAKKELFHARMIGAPPFPGELAGLLRGLHRKYKLAVVTSSGRSEIEPLLEAAGLRGYFETLVCAHDTALHKPAPDPYLLAANRLAARTPLVLEDSEAGLASARAAGFEVLAVRHPREMPDLLLRRLSGSLPA
jgi:HAD superfamily hydrolase (TIGR01509 family)